MSGYTQHTHTQTHTQFIWWGWGDGIKHWEWVKGLLYTRGLTSLDTPKAMEMLGGSGRAYVIPKFWKAETRDPQSKPANCVQVKGHASMNKVWFNQGRFPTSPLDIHMYAHTCEHTSTCMYAHTYTNTNMHRGKRLHIGYLTPNLYDDAIWRWGLWKVTRIRLCVRMMIALVAL